MVGRGKNVRIVPNSSETSEASQFEAEGSEGPSSIDTDPPALGMLQTPKLKGFLQVQATMFERILEEKGFVAVASSALRTLTLLNFRLQSLFCQILVMLLNTLTATFEKILWSVLGLHLVISYCGSLSEYYRIPSSLQPNKLLLHKVLRCPNLMQLILSHKFELNMPEDDHGCCR